MKRAFILGSGFSRAISTHMPTMAELSTIVQSEIAFYGLPPIPGHDTAVALDFERWLSYLAESPPWLSEGETLRNRAAFSDVARAVHAALSATQYLAAAEPQPDWLGTLVRYWEATSSTVITFNYDVLVEMAWLSQNAPKPWFNLYPIPTTPAASRVGTVWGGEVATTGMRLLKLHGSLNWYYSGPSGPAGDTIFDLGVAGPWSIEGTAGRYDNKYVSDRQPCIVPPAAVKSPYYGNQTIHALWQQAAEAISDADEVVVVGFSLPPSDQLVTAMLATRLRPETLVVPVNIDAEITPRLQAVLEPDSVTGCDSIVIADYAGTANPIERWVESFAT